MPLEFYDEHDAFTPVHPALDIVDGQLFVTVQVRLKGQGLSNIILTSKGEALTEPEWDLWSGERGLVPVVKPTLKRNTGPRWTAKGIRELQDGTLKARTWEEAYTAIYEALDARLVVRDSRYLVVMTLFVMMTYFHPLFEFLPILHLRGPAESGKSRAGGIIGHLAFNGIVEGSPTPSTIFRHAHDGRYTQVVAEADQLAGLDSGDPFVRQLQSSCSKAEATVEVSEGKSNSATYQPATYFTFSPKVILSTREFKSQPLRSRRIKLDMVKVPNADEIKLRASVTDDAVWQPLRDDLFRLLLTQWTSVAAARDALKGDWRGPKAPTGRTFEKWLPVATIAYLVSAETLQVIQELAHEDMSEQQSNAEGTFESDIMKFARYVTRNGDQKLSAKELYREFLDTGIAQIYGAPLTPIWAEATGTPVTVDQCRQWVKTDRSLVAELQRLNLIPRQSEHKRAGNVYSLSSEHIRATVEQYMGDIEIAGSASEPAVPPVSPSSWPQTGTKTGTDDMDLDTHRRLASSRW